MQYLNKRRNHRRDGMALLVVIIFVMTVAAMGAAVLGVDLQTGKSRRLAGSDQRAFYAAEAAISEAYVSLLNETIDVPLGQTLEVGTSGQPGTLGTSEYWSQITRLDSRRYALVGSGRNGESERRQQLIISHAPNSLFQYAAFGGDGVQFDSNAFVDSYDSALGTYASQVQSGLDWARQEAVVGSNGDIQLRSNTRVYGDCHPGPNGVVYDTAPGVIVTGSTAPAPSIVTLPAVPPPLATSLGPATWTTDQFVGPGVVRFDSIDLSSGATLTIQGPTQLVVDDFLMGTGTTLVFDTSSGPIELYSAHDFVLESNTTVVTNENSAVDVKLFLSGDNRGNNPNTNDQVSLSANAAFTGVIYAPNAEILLGSNFEIYGSVMAGALDLSSNGRIHFDEALLYDSSGSSLEFVTVHWSRMHVN
ncbi:MAG: hypothetical protein ACJAQ3_001673 [Planctomycetota bacterium]|jgi:hypothetical protein